MRFLLHRALDSPLSLFLGSFSREPLSLGSGSLVSPFSFDSSQAWYSCAHLNRLSSFCCGRAYTLPFFFRACISASCFNSLCARASLPFLDSIFRFFVLPLRACFTSCEPLA